MFFHCWLKVMELNIKWIYTIHFKWLQNFPTQEPKKRGREGKQEGRKEEGRKERTEGGRKLRQLLFSVNEIFLIKDILKLIRICIFPKVQDLEIIMKKLQVFKTKLHPKWSYFRVLLHAILYEKHMKYCFTFCCNGDHR